MQGIVSDYENSAITEDMINEFRKDQQKTNAEVDNVVDDSVKDTSSRKSERKRKPKKHGDEDYVIPEKKIKATDELKKNCASRSKTQEGCRKE